MNQECLREMEYPPATTTKRQELLARSTELDVIAVGAHPDDVEIAVGGTLATLVEQGYKVGIIDLTDGEPTPGSSGPQERYAEAGNAAEKLGIHVRIILPLPNRRLMDCFESRVELAKEFRRFRPKLVMGIADKTPLASPDHWQATQITDAAVFYSRLTKWDATFENLPVHTVKQQLWFPLGIRNLVQASHENSLLVDISSKFEQKLDSLRCYKSQFPTEKADIFDKIRAQNQNWGTAAGVHAAEIIYSPSPLITKNLMHSIFG